MSRVSTLSAVGWFVLGLSSAVACAEQREGIGSNGSAPSGSGGSGSTSGGASSGSAGSSTSGSGGNLTPGSAGTATAGSGGTATAGMGGSGGGGSGGSGGSSGEGGGFSSAGAGGAPECTLPGDCDDENACTDDSCEGGECTHVDNETCECLNDAQCGDEDVCTFDRCSGNSCDNPSNGSCGTGSVFVINSFNSTTDWGNDVTTPDGRAQSWSGFAGTNLEGDANVYLAASVSSSLTMTVADMTGLSAITLSIQSTSTGTAGMVKIGAYDGETWSDLPLSTYGAIDQNSYGTLSVPIVDFGFPQGDITQIRLLFAPTGGERIWRIDEITTVD